MERMETTTGILISLKNISYGVAFLIGAVGLDAEAFAVLGVLVIIDTITGVLRSMTIYGGRSFTSSKLTSGVVAKALIVSVPLLVAWAGRGAGIDMENLAQGVLSVLIFAELYSILGNIYAIHIQKDVKEFDAVAFILDKVRDTIEVVIKNSTKIDPPKGKD